MRTLILIAKAPRVGVAKTRLARSPGIGARGAAELAAAFLRDTVDHCRAVPKTQLLVGYAPSDAKALFQALAPTARLVPQADGDLGARLRAAFDAAFASGADRAIAIGCDAPHVSPAVYQLAFERLDSAQGVIGPSEDGGYYLIGLRARAPSLFDGIAWSTDRVLEETMQRARAAGIALAELPANFDVDEPEDLDRLRAHLAGGAAGSCPYTERLLRELAGA